jgi:hypothetical protein
MNGAVLKRQSLLLAFLLSGCTTHEKDSVDTGVASDAAAPGGDDATEPAHDGATGAATDADSGGPVEPDGGVDDTGQTGARFSLPLGNASYVRGTIDLQIASERVDADRVQLRLNGQLHVTLSLPFRYSWDSEQFPEGSYEWSATVLAAGRQVGSASRTFKLDRSPPRVVGLEHAAGLSSIDPEQPITLQLSEPLPLDDVRAALSASPGVTLSETADPLRFVVKLPAASLPATFAFGISTRLHDGAGQALPTGFETTFYVPAWRLVSNTDISAFSLGSAGDQVWAGLRIKPGPGVGLARLNPDWTFTTAALNIPTSSNAIPSQVAYAYPGGALVAMSSAANTVDVVACDDGLVCRAFPTFTTASPFAILYDLQYRLLSGGTLWLIDPTVGESGASNGSAWFDPRAEFRASHAGMTPEVVGSGPLGDLFVYNDAQAVPVVAQKRAGGFEDIAKVPPPLGNHTLHQSADGRLYALFAGYAGSPNNPNPAKDGALLRYDAATGFAAVNGISGYPLQWVSNGSVSVVVSPVGAFELDGTRIGGPLPAMNGMQVLAAIWRGKPLVLFERKLLVPNNPLK